MSDLTVVDNETHAAFLDRCLPERRILKDFVVEFYENHPEIITPTDVRISGERGWHHYIKWDLIKEMFLLNVILFKKENYSIDGQFDVAFKGIIPNCKMKSVEKFELIFSVGLSNHTVTNIKNNSDAEVRRIVLQKPLFDF